jgi:hypothetical protein
MKFYKVLSALCLSFLFCLQGSSILAQSIVGASQSVTLAWNPSSDAAVAGYAIYSGKLLIFTNRQNLGNVSSATITNLDLGIPYVFFIKAYDATGRESEPSNLIIHTPLASPTAPSVSIALNRSTLPETDSAGAVVTIQRSGLTLLPLVVALRTEGNAKPGINFQGLPAIITFLPGQSSVSYPVTPIRDRLVTGNKTAVLSLIPNINYQIGTSSPTLTIEDQDFDTDHDGMSDAAEQLAGTATHNAASNLKITRIVPGPNSQVTFHWNSVPGVSYRVLSKALHEPNWTPVSPAIIANGTSSTWTLTATNPSAIYGLGL